MALLLREEDVDRLLDMPTALGCVERAFIEWGMGRATNQSRHRVHQRHGGLHLMAAALPAFGVIGFKAYTWFTSGSKFIVQIYSSETGELLAIIEADRLGQIRTGAASGIATQWMAREDASAVGIFGTGFQAESQLEGVCAVRRVKTVRVFSRRKDRREAFCKMMEARLGIEVRASQSPKEVVEGAEILITATTSSEPLFDGDWIAPGTHLNVIGGNSLYRTEVDTDTVIRSHRIVVDSLAQAKQEAGELVKAVERGLLLWEKVVELGSVVTRRVHARESADDVTMFKSLGIALEDLAVAATVYERAVGSKVGERILE